MNTALLPFKHPYTMVVCGPTQSSKTGFVLKLIDNSSTVIQPAPVKILYCFSEYQPATFDSYRNRVQFYKGLPSTDVFDGLAPTLVILDDLMDDVDQSVVDLFTKVSHHRNLSIGWVPSHLSAGSVVRGFTCPQVHLSAGSVVRGFTCPQTCKIGRVGRNNGGIV
jgi:hypothetical protein